MPTAIMQAVVTILKVTTKAIAKTIKGNANIMSMSAMIARSDLPPL